MQLNTKPEFDKHDELTPQCIADLLDEIASHQEERMQRIKESLLKLKRGDRITVDFSLTFNAQDSE